MAIHKQILEWQAAHPNITWIGWGICLGDCPGGPVLAASCGVTNAVAGGIGEYMRRRAA